jgi:hypothetical protein
MQPSTPRRFAACAATAVRDIPGQEFELWSWTAADDGATLAWFGRAPSDLNRDAGAEHQTLHVVELDHGTERIVAPLETGALGTALATSARVTVAGDNRGDVHVWRDGVRADLDLRGRYDVAIAAAISPDDTHIALGTARGRLLIIALEPAVAP